ncbi:MAG: hypothetical protein M2R45_03855 [Verrucomicrobia subdivision 3 bacterium]|nr:hypothetical protein [Limisphaerales bacterium]MCS1415811.1 hypothetical protein [Limisphaerales bacterium]
MSKKFALEIRTRMKKVNGKNRPVYEPYLVPPPKGMKFPLKG